MVGSELEQHESMDPTCLVSTDQAGEGGVMVWGIFSWHSLGPLKPINHHLKAAASLSIFADYVHPFMATMYPSSNDYFQHDNVPCNKANVVSNWFHEHDTECSSVTFPVTGFESNIAHLGCGLPEAIMLTWNRISKEGFQHLESMPLRIEFVRELREAPVLV